MKILQDDLHWNLCDFCITNLNLILFLIDYILCISECFIQYISAEGGKWTVNLG